MKSLLLMSLFFCTSAFAWGPTGHRVVGEVAEKFLKLKTKAEVQKILGTMSLARVANWADEIKSEPATYSHTYNWHYTDWADDAHEHDETSSSGKLLTAINEQLAVLKDTEASQDKKVFAMKFLVHLVGDLHMPLHVGNGLDQGGNFCKVTFHGKVMNLHALWDEALIDFTNLSFTELANFVTQGRTIEQINTWRQGTVVDWAQESKVLRTRIYPENVSPVSAPMSIKQYCQREVTPEQMPKLSYEYSYQFVPVVEQRLFQAGVRLAHLLNSNL